MRYRVVKRVAKKDLGENILSDETIQLTGQRTSKEYPDAMRRVKARVKVDGKWRTMVFLTNNFEWSASTIAELYKARWEVELLFKELKQTLQLQDFYGENANAVEWQIWAALLTHLVLRWLKYKSGAACSYSRFAALCDIRPEAVEESRKWLVDRKKPGAMREYKGREDSWKGVCDDPDVDVVYICAPAISAVCSVAPTSCPHLEQKRAPGTNSAPHLGQNTVNTPFCKRPPAFLFFSQAESYHFWFVLSNPSTADDLRHHIRPDDRNMTLSSR